MTKQKKMTPPKGTEGIFFDRTSMFSMVQKLAVGQVPNVIMDSLRSIQDSSFDLSLAFAFACKLVEWEIREPGVLRRHTLEEARRLFPVNYPCFLVIDNKPVFANLKEDGVLVYPEGLPVGLIKLLGELIRLEHLVELPVRAGERDIRMNEEFMNQLMEHYDKARRDSAPSGDGSH
jgi:hypothetical protein